jgi:Domain of unknown function (DUF4326)
VTERIQRRRTRGWRMPTGAVYVGRGSQWGNPWRVGSTTWTIDPGGLINRQPHPPLTDVQAVASFRNSVLADPERIAYIRAELAGRDLACWCPLDQPCHADVLLEVARG